MPKITKQQQEIDQLRRELAERQKLVGDLKSSLSRVFRELSKWTPDLLEARKLCLDTSPTQAWKVEVTSYAERGSYVVGQQLFYTRAAAEDYAEANEDDDGRSRSVVHKTRPGDKAFA
ncbi:MAG TPA: hypothetical protein P5305_04025 [Rubrivivax sp.]|nr:hypothetical protein [Rubrivivax sp.]HRY87030.1 hypothetical protein [Rubrivivax sp.]